ncbi:MAG: FRG domain-containing protein [Pseudomonadota bacterium]|nr:FRG domain-containing protein [Pseudomonadota bacterium]
MTVEIITSASQVIGLALDAAMRNDGPQWWRGQAHASWSLRPTIAYHAGGYQAEKNMLAMFRLGAPSRHTTLPTHEDVPGWLFLARHHGLPSRLLDWTESPLVALFFAVYPTDFKNLPDNEDSALWRLSPCKLNKKFLDLEKICLPESPKVVPLFKRALTGEPRTKDAIAAVAAPELDLRMLLQQSRFTIHDTDLPLEQLTAGEGVVQKYVIPATNKMMVRAELEALGMRWSSIFPDSGSLANYVANLKWKDTV